MTNPEKATIMSCDLSQPNLGVDEQSYNTIVSHATHIIHAAWPVNFQLGLSTFDASLRGLQNLLNLSLKVRASRPARFIFCSSISTALGTPAPAIIPEEPIPHLTHVSHTGYAQSKLVSEKIVEAAVKTAGVNAGIYRIGQIIGDTHQGIWNDSEAFPLIIRSALTMGVLPESDMDCEWLPVDTCAASIIDIEKLNKSHGSASTNGDHTTPQVSGTAKQANQQQRLVYNLRSPRTFTWTKDLLPALAATGLSFRPIPFAEWTQQLRTLSSGPSKTNTQAPKFGSNGTNGEILPREAAAAADPEQNPALKLIDFFERDFAPREQGAAGVGKIVFDIEAAVGASPALRDAPDVLGSGLLEKMMGVWMGKWRRGV